MGFQLIHMAEGYTGGFPHEIVELFDSPRDWPEREFLLVFGLGSPYRIQEHRLLKAEEQRVPEPR
ncbi:hypothetical protein SAMN04488564_12262 [Lentzea waywayandensis]|uniref:Uncharacterized protein n=1 Tax=Lentzea waywayandensis TaxID=84724 RepID=A0A1I6FIU3_9PSEU|nr:hypothetical protein [Lentzea waywayandensis]SFR29873.1 hypothetical protein SAMN04488564_12262 [Lentzea waywayandensis]